MNVLGITLMIFSLLFLYVFHVSMKNEKSVKRQFSYEFQKDKIFSFSLLIFITGYVYLL